MRVTVSNLVIFDTSVFVDHLRSGRHQHQIESVTGLIRTSSVVLAELWRGATKPAEREFLRALQRNHPILTPTEKNWLESGQILARTRADKGFTPDKLRDLHFDVLIALTARSYGARLVTSDRSDFEMIKSLLQSATRNMVASARVPYATPSPPISGPRALTASYPGNARPRQPLHHAEVHPGLHQATHGSLRQGASEGVTRRRAYSNPATWSQCSLGVSAWCFGDCLRFVKSTQTTQAGPVE